MPQTYTMYRARYDVCSEQPWILTWKDPQEGRVQKIFPSLEKAVGYVEKMKRDNMTRISG